MTRRMMAMVMICAQVLLPAGQAAAQDVQPHISVQGTGSIAVAPDMARITLGVLHDAPTAAAAMDGMSIAMEAVLDRIKTAGIDPKHVQTGSLRLDQRYDNIDGVRAPVGYSARADVRVQVFDLAMLGGVLDAAVRDGANAVNGLQFDVADRAPHMTAARQAAVKDARAKADVYVAAAGANLGALLMISEGNARSVPMPMMEAASFDMAARSVPVAAGELTISSTINMMWALVQE